MFANPASPRFPRTLVLIMIIAAVGTGPARATVWVDLSAGWKVGVPDGVYYNMSASGDRVTLGFIYTTPPQPGEGFQPLDIVMRQSMPDGSTISNLKMGFSLTNGSIAAWTGMGIDLVANGKAWLDGQVRASQNVFADRVYVDEYGFGDPLKASGLRFSNGKVLPGQKFSAFSSNQELQPVQTDLSGIPPLSFTVRFTPVPEPAMFSAMFACLAGMIVRRRRPMREVQFAPSSTLGKTNR